MEGVWILLTRSIGAWFQSPRDYWYIDNNTLKGLSGKPALWPRDGYSLFYNFICKYIYYWCKKMPFPDKTFGEKFPHSRKPETNSTRSR